MTLEWRLLSKRKKLLYCFNLVILMAKPKTSKAKNMRYLWNVGDMTSAVKLVKEKQLTVYKAAKLFKVPINTLNRRIKGIYDKPGQKPALSNSLDKQLTQHIKDCCDIGLGLTPQKIRKLAFQLVQKSKVKNVFNTTKEIASKTWYKRFAKKHDLVVRLAQNLSRDRAKLTMETIQQFFDLVKKVLQDCNYVCG